jgi:hypothetical protein
VRGRRCVSRAGGARLVGWLAWRDVGSGENLLSHGLGKQKGYRCVFGGSENITGRWGPILRLEGFERGSKGGGRARVGVEDAEIGWRDETDRHVEPGQRLAADLRTRLN